LPFASELERRDLYLHAIDDQGRICAWLNGRDTDVRSCRSTITSRSVICVDRNDSRFGLTYSAATIAFVGCPDVNGYDPADVASDPRRNAALPFVLTTQRNAESEN
jgi:hypothetical protein